MVVDLANVLGNVGTSVVRGIKDRRVAHGGLIFGRAFASVAAIVSFENFSLGLLVTNGCSFHRAKQTAHGLTAIEYMTRRNPRFRNL
jgi:hypothetical protein